MRLARMLAKPKSSRLPPPAKLTAAAGAPSGSSGAGSDGNPGDPDDHGPFNNLRRPSKSPFSARMVAAERSRRRVSTACRALPDPTPRLDPELEVGGLLVELACGRTLSAPDCGGTGGCAVVIDLPTVLVTEVVTELTVPLAVVVTVPTVPLTVVVTVPTVPLTVVVTVPTVPLAVVVTVPTVPLTVVVTVPTVPLTVVVTVPTVPLTVVVAVPTVPPAGADPAPTVRPAAPDVVTGAVVWLTVAGAVRWFGDEGAVEIPRVVVTGVMTGFVTRTTEPVSPLSGGSAASAVVARESAKHMSAKPSANPANKRWVPRNRAQTRAAASQLELLVPARGAG